MQYYFILTIKYDGSDFSGWAKQSDTPTIQGEIERAIFSVSKNKEFRTLGASKTDAGVHALDQKVWVQLGYKPDFEGFIRGLNRSLPNSIRVFDMFEVDDSFKVRNCIEKTYKYTINLGEYDILTQRFEHYPRTEFNLDEYKEALKLFVGEHDFVNFSGLKEHELDSINTVRSVKTIEVMVNNNKVETYFNAKGFIRYQIRMMVGASLAYCYGKISLDKIKSVLNLEESKMLHIAESKGLILMDIKY